MYKSLGLLAVVLLLVAFGFWYSYSNTSNTSDPTMNTNTTNITNTNSAALAIPGVPVTSSDVVYFETTKGYFARPTDEGNYPGIVMVHEWWGLNDNIKDTARQLAGQSYAVLAVDLYNGTVAAAPDQAMKLVSSLDQKKATENLQAAAEYLRRHGARRIASLGWCFGGGQSLQLALSGVQLDATVIYYGQLVNDSQRLAAISWPVLGIFGDKDTSIPVATVEKFQAALDETGIDNEIHIYPGVGHAFANPSGANYAPVETADAWQKTLGFLGKNLATAN